MGTKVKFWVTNPDDDRPWLFKFSRERDGVVRGEDWAEWVVHQVSGLIGVPTAFVRPAHSEGHRGIVSRSVVNHVNLERLVHGNSLLSEVDPAYDGDLMRANPRYTVNAVRSALEEVEAPAEFAGPQHFAGFDVWTGYLVMDALVAGRDRHHENWGIISSQSGRMLAPSFDHGNALGFQENDEHRISLLANPSAFDRWLARGKSHHFASKPSLLALAHEALAATPVEVRRFWIERLRSISLQDVRSIVESVPNDIMSDPTRNFATSIISANRERVLRDYPDC
jgi:hypothetical protein